MRWWKVFGGHGEARAKSAPGRRRESDRFAHRAPVQARCSSWPRFVELFTGDVSAGGLFVPTSEPAELGERIELELELPDRGRLPLIGRVVNVITPEQAAAAGRPPGIGIQIETPAGEDARRFQLILEIARSRLPRPEPGSTEPPPRRRPFRHPTGAEPVRLSSVHRAIGPDLIPEDAEDRAARAPAPPSGPTAERPPSIAPRRPIGRGTLIGIDMGTTNTAVAAIVGDQVRVVEGPAGPCFPSIIHFQPDGVRVGETARAALRADANRVVVAPKRLLARSFDDPEVQEIIARAPWRARRAAGDRVAIEIDGRVSEIPELCAMILGHALASAEQGLGETIEGAVVSVPISFDEAAVDELRRAGEMAGVEIVAVIDEPSAAALANRFEPGFGGLVGIYDFGGGTFDFSIVDVSSGDFAVLATAGDRWLGGDDFDRRLAEAAAEQFHRKHRIDVRQQPVEWQALLWACEQAKRELSAGEVAAIVVPDVAITAAGSLDLRFTIDREIFERACGAVIARSLDCCREALDRVGLRPDQLSAIYLSGGTTYTPAVRRAVAAAFDVPVKTGVPPDFAVCLGTGIHAAQLQLRTATTL
jgi:actin-like ATPase involved in cell morphogenesis/Tfp pilus assembly protein PilZ